MKSLSKRQQWMLLGGGGASLFCFGLCGAIEIALLKYEGVAWSLWVPLGTAALTIMVFGLVLMIKSGHIGASIAKET